MTWLSNLSIKYKFLMVPLVTVIGFLTYLLFSVNANNHNTERLIEIREKHYPVLEIANANIALVDRITETFSSAVSTGEEEMINDAIKLYENFKINNERINDLIPVQISAIQQIKSQADTYISLTQSLSNGMLEGTLDPEHIRLSVTEMNTALDLLKASLVKFQKKSYLAFTSTLIEADKESQETIKIGLIIAALSMLTMFITSFAVILMLNRNIQAVLDSLKDIAEGEGDLTCRIEQQSKDEIGELVHWFNLFMAKLQNTIGNVVSVIPSLTNVSVDLAQITVLTKDRAREQHQSADNVSNSITEMIVAVSEMAQHASSAAVAATEADQTARNGQKVVNQTVESITNLANEVENTAVIISQLEQDTENVDSILEVIKGVAEQTNLLALNAAIEAARAGENGRGFAVVADEVRTLASRTQQSTLEIQAVIEKLQSTAQSAVGVMKMGQEQASQSVQQAKKTGESLHSITSKVQSISDMNIGIAAATEQQKQSSESIHNHIVGMKDSAGNIVESSECINGLSGELENVSQKLKLVCGQFKV